MTDPTASNPFTFNPLINPDVIYDLYENDYPYIQEIFNTVLTNIDADIGEIRSAHAATDLEALKKNIHKIKPTFGFLGMQLVEQKCRDLEDKCRSSQSVASLTGDLDELLLLINKAQKAIQEDYQKLIIHNKPRL
jgi:HPt (histidine-containing phosphotransfer) domain-containing protein